MAKKSLLEGFLLGMLDSITRPPKRRKKRRHLGSSHYYYPRGYNGKKGRRK